MLATTIEKTRKLWLGSGWSTDQPKWHLLFDGHLVDQVHMFWGLADKLDDVIEKACQPWKKEKEQTWNIKNFQKQHLAAVQKRKHFKIRAELEITRQLQKHKRKAEAKVEGIVVKREGHLHTVLTQ
jgi:hypothetical protein